MSEKFDAGLAVRREVMGDAFVDKAFANADAFSMPLQAMLTENAWGEVWTREGLSRRDRSLITVAMLAALKAPQELKGHIRGAIRNGVSVEELQEVLLHSVVYCGAPAAQEAFRAAREVLEEN